MLTCPKVSFIVRGWNSKRRVRYQISNSTKYDNSTYRSTRYDISTYRISIFRYIGLGYFDISKYQVWYFDISDFDISIYRIRLFRHIKVPCMTFRYNGFRYIEVPGMIFRYVDRIFDIWKKSIRHATQPAGVRRTLNMSEVSEISSTTPQMSIPGTNGNVGFIIWKP